MSRGAFFRSLEVLYHAHARATLRYILQEAESFIGHHDCVRNGQRRLTLVLDRSGVILDIKPDIALRLGYTQDQLLGKNLYEIMPEYTRAYRWQFHEQAVNTGRMVQLYDTGRQGHKYDMLLVPILHRGQTERVLVFIGEMRQFVEVQPDGTSAQI